VERYICIHGHFYQPPRENPWLEAIEIQDSAHPYHDWNERVTSECYAPNSASRIRGDKGRITDIVSNYASISFNFGPTLLSWMETSAPELYQAVLDADRQGMAWRSGHGNAIAQCYNHLIMPLANSRDKLTQVVWGIRDFEHRFGRFPEGMWLPETAVDPETLDILAAQGIKFTILAPRQAARIRRIGTEKWQDVRGSRIDPTRAYLCILPSGRRITVFFYDGPISQAVAFEKLLNSGEDFAGRLVTGFSDSRQWPQILNIATDGETYGHHHRFGDMALANALGYIEKRVQAALTNYGEYLSRYPPAYEVEVLGNSSWSCYHGIERWRGDCGCSTGGHPGWNQRWRAPLREALDWLRDRMLPAFGDKAGEYLRDPWKARDEYIDVILDRSEESVEAFLAGHALKELNSDEKVTVLKLLENQRHAMLMYTSCGWFFDDISGIETVQVIQYAGRAIQLAEGLFGTELEGGFLERLAGAKSNVAEEKDGMQIYVNTVRPVMINVTKVGVHYAVSSLFEEYADKTSIYSYEVFRDEYQRREAGKMKIAVGKISVSSRITRETETLSFCVFHLGGHAVYCGARAFQGDDPYLSMKEELLKAFEGGDFLDIVRLLDTHFGMHNYSFKDLFRDEQRKILDTVIQSTLDEFEQSYRRMYGNSRILMGFLRETEVPVPHAFYTAAEFTLNLDIRKALTESVLDFGSMRQIIGDIESWDVALEKVDLEFAARQRLEKMMGDLYENPSDPDGLEDILELVELLETLPLELNLWETQNIFYKVAKCCYRKIAAEAASGNPDAARWVDAFGRLGARLTFNVNALTEK
jgi:alpha-amylase/alpha-mannosidase (GH57 family)